MIHIPTEPIETDPIAVYQDLDIPEVQALLDEALAGVPLGAYDERIVEWLKKASQPTIVTMASIIHRARQHGSRQRILDTKRA